MKALILGGGFAGTTTAFLLKREGWDVTLVEKEPHLGGGCRTFFHCGHPYQNGPRLYYGYSKPIFDWVNRFVQIRRFPFELRTLAHEPVASERRFWSYPPHVDDVPRYPRSEQIKRELSERDNRTEPLDFDEYYRQKIGPTLYEMFTDHYSRRMWMIDSNKVFDTFAWSAKDEPLASGTRDAYKGSYIGFPVPANGYNDYFDAMAEGVEVVLGDFASVQSNETGEWRVWFDGGRKKHLADAIVSTIPIDELVGEPDALPWIGREFQKLVLPCAQVFPGDVRFCHYAGAEDEWTRVTEFKKLTYYESPETLLLLEKPARNGTKMYAYQTKANLAKVAEYQKMLPPNVYSIGRLGTYRYSTIEQTIAMAFKCAAKITGKPNEMEGQDFAIGDKSMLAKDRKVA